MDQIASTSSGLSTFIRDPTVSSLKSSKKSNKSDSGVSSTASSTLSLEEVTCRICFRGNNEEALAQTCHCKGSIGMVHKSCLERWVAQKRLGRCDICGYRYKTEIIRKSYLHLLFEEKEARREPLGHLCRGLALLLTVLVLMPLCCGYVAQMKFSFLSASLYVLICGHSMFWLKRPVVHFLEFYRLMREWRRKSGSVRIHVAQPNIYPRPAHVTEIEDKLRRQRVIYNFIVGTFLVSKIAFFVPLAALYIIDMISALQKIMVYYLCLILVVVAISWSVASFSFFWAAYQNLMAVLNSPSKKEYIGWFKWFRNGDKKATDDQEIPNESDNNVTSSMQIVQVNDN